MSSDLDLAKQFGSEMAKVIRRRLDDLDAAESLDVMRSLPGRCHALAGDRDGQLAIDLRGPKRLIFEPKIDPTPKLPSGGLDWKRITAIRVLEVEDYH